MKDLSVITLSYNTRDLTLQTIHSLKQSLSKTPSVSYEIIVIDNGSTDGSVESLKKEKGIVFIENGKNVGFGAANNIAAKHARGTYLLLLNSDTIVDHVDFAKLLKIMHEHSDIGVLTVRLVLPDGSIDPASHRGFPTLWRSFAYFSKLEKLTTKIPGLNRLFGGYHLSHLDKETEHEIDSPSGAFFLTRKEIFDAVGGFDEAFFMYGEDLDLSLRIKQAGYKIWYYPLMSIVHIKGQSGRKHTDVTQKKKTSSHFYEAMRIFYKKHYEKQYPLFINKAVYRILEAKK
ncbi:glycosyltransferase family 2 protein [Candidatus Microgenomates bacterium]|nr:glycosyltransferase family 2 protein [Candidatus Microgenomates bacterium]